MSSHHIVRDKQEPALVIFDLDNFDEEHLGQLLEWSPTVLVAPNVYEKVAAMGIKIDVVLYNIENKKEFQERIKFIEIKCETDNLNASLNFFINQNYPSVNLICNKFDFNCVKQYVSQINIVIFSNNKKYYPIKSGFKKWSVGNSIIEVLGYSSNYTGLRLLTENEFITLKDGFFSLTFDKEFLFIGEDL